MKRRRFCTSMIAVALLVSSSAAWACRDISAAPHSRWGTTTERGIAWLVTPCGERFFSVGVNIVDGGLPERDGPDGYRWERFQPSLPAWAKAARDRLAAWGFNTAGAWSLAPAMLDLPATIELSLGRRVNFMWLDPFDPTLPARVRAEAERQIAPYRGDKRRIGYFSDNEIGWWNGPLFTAYTRYSPRNYSKQRLVQLLREHYGADWMRFLHDFVPPHRVRSFDDLLQETVASTQLRPDGNGIAVVRQWTQLLADRYYAVMREAIKSVDPEGLYLGDRLPIYYDPDAVRAMVPHVDLIATNYNADGPDGWIARYYFEGLRQIADKPVLVTEWFFAANENRTGNLNRTGLPKSSKTDVDPSNNINRTGHLMTVATQSERAAGAAIAAEALSREPNVVGLHWFQFYDHPSGGRLDGEDYNFGLVDVRDRAYEELTQTLSRVNGELPRLHAEGRSASGEHEGRVLPYAAIDPRDHSLAEWPKHAARIPLRSAPGEAVFGDVYVSWSEAGLNVAAIAMDYYDRDLMAFTDRLPLHESFRVNLTIGRSGTKHEIQLVIVPETSLSLHEKLTFRVVGCRVDRERCDPMPVDASFFGVAMDQPRMIFEARLPWEELGAPPEPAGEVALEVGVISFYRSRWMSLSGADPRRSGALRAGLTTVKLAPAKKEYTIR